MKDIFAGGGNIDRGFYLFYYENPYGMTSHYFEDFIYLDGDRRGSIPDRHPGCYWMVLE